MPVPGFVANACQVRLGWDLAGEVAYNVLNFQIPSPALVNQGLADSVGSAIKQAFTASWAPHCTNNIHLAKVGIRDLRAPHQFEYLDGGASAPGTSAGTELAPRAAAVCVTLRTAGAGKSFRGRVYLPGASEADNIVGAQGGPLGLAAAAFVNDIASRLQPLNLTLGVLSRPQPEVLIRRVTMIDGAEVEDRVLSHQTQKNGVITPVTSVEVRNSRWEYQRRRDNGRGQGVSSLQGPLVSYAIGQPV